MFEAMRLLLTARAELNAGAVHSPLGMACMADDPQGVLLLCEARAAARRPLEAVDKLN